MTLEEVTNFLEEYIDQLEDQGITPTAEDIKRKLVEISQVHNNTPKEHFEGYSSAEMRMIMNCTFDESSPILFNRLTSPEYAQIPILRQIKRVAEIVSANSQIKLTAAGYLPLRIVKELYPLGSPDIMIEMELSKLSRKPTACLFIWQE